MRPKKQAHLKYCAARSSGAAPPRVDVSNRNLGRVLCVTVAMCVAGCTAVQIPDPDVVYLAFGDSTTEGPSGSDYADFLPDLLNVPAARIAKQGQSGEGAADGVARLQSLIDLDLFPNARVLLYWQGATDVIDFIRDRDPFLLFAPADTNYPYSDALDQTLDQVQANIEAAVGEARDAGLIVFVATYFSLPESRVDCSPLPLGLLLPAQSQRANQIVDMLNERIRLAAAASGASVIDVADIADVLLSNSANYFNCNHLSEDGNQLVANLVADEILRRGLLFPDPVPESP